MQFLKPATITALIFGIFIGIGIDRYWPGTVDTNTAAPEGEATLEHARQHLDPDYVCPMHSEVVSKESGSCPICGMDLVKREPPANTEVATGSLPEVMVTPEFIHNFGVRTATVIRGPVSRRIMALGRVSRMPLPKVTDVSPGLPGKVISVNGKKIGDSVDKGELLYTVDAPEWRSLQHAYLESLDDEEDNLCTDFKW